MKILAFGAHFDDLELGCGGSLSRWSCEGDQVVGVVLTDSGFSDESGKIVRDTSIAQEEGRRAAKLAGYKLIEGPFKTFGLSDSSKLNEYILKVIGNESPDVILTHARSDSHTDHIAVYHATIHCARHTPRVLTYRSNWYLSGEVFNPNFFVDISDQMEKKIELLKIYSSEVARSSGKWLEWTEQVGRVNGLISGTKFAEAFEVVKWLW